MNKIGITILILATLGIGYWVSIGNKNQAKSPVTEKIDLFADSKKEESQNQTQVQEPVGEVKDKIINNQKENIKVMSAILHTSKGDITIAFNPETPKTVENFIKLAKEGFYDGTKFHRVIKDFMSQGGDPLSKDDSKSASWGTGGPGYKFADEITDTNSNDIGTISMANAGPDTNGSQFFINAAANNFLDTKHTVFGKVTAGLDVALAINNVKTGANDRPLEPVIIKSITLK
jgi:peptidylprolyl isomerase